MGTENVKPAPWYERVLPAWVLLLAADYVERNGYHQQRTVRDNCGRFHMSEEPAASVEGAVAFVVYGYPVRMPDQDGSPEVVLFRRAINACVDQLEQFGPTGQWEPFTEDGVLTQLRAAAELWMDRHPPGGAA